MFYWSISAVDKWLLSRSTIRDKIIPHAVSWFTGEAAENDEYELEDEEDDDDDDEEADEVEEDEDDDDDDEDEDDVNSKKKVSNQ